MNEKGVYGIRAEQIADHDPKLRTIPWLNSLPAVKVRFKCYNWYYTGYNSVMKPVVHDGYIEPVDICPQQKYYLEGRGFCTLLESEDDLPCFIFICM